MGISPVREFPAALEALDYDILLKEYRDLCDRKLMPDWDRKDQVRFVWLGWQLRRFDELCKVETPCDVAFR